MLFSYLRYPASILILSSIAQAQECADTEHTLNNATGSILIPGFQPFISTPPDVLLENDTWTVNTGISAIPDASTNSYNVEQSFWLETAPPIDTAPADLPYTGCAILLTGFKSPRISTGTNRTDSCNGVFDTSCYNAIISTINTFALENTASTIPNVCNTIIATPPAQCKDYAWTSVVSSQPFGNPSFPGTANASCHSNIFNGTADLLSQTSPSTSPLTNYTTYDAWVKQATPLVLTAFTKNVTEQTPRWGATQLVCLTPEVIASGSRAPAKSSGAGRNTGLGILGLAAAVGVVVAGEVLW